MRSSTECDTTDAGQVDSLKDERNTGWQPDRISDRKLIELANRLEKVQRLGDAFADIQLAPELRQRFVNLPQSPAD